MPILEKKRKKQDKAVSLVKFKLNSTKILTYWALNYSYITYIEFVSVNNVLREYDNIKEEIKNLKNSTVHQIF